MRRADIDATMFISENGVPQVARVGATTPKPLGTCASSKCSVT